MGELKKEEVILTFLLAIKCWGLDIQYSSISVGLYSSIYIQIKERLTKHAHGNIYIQTAISPLTQMTKTCVLPLFRLFEVLIKWSIIQRTNLTIFFHITWFGPVWKGLERLRPLASLIFLFEHNRNILRVCQRVIIRSQSLLIQHIWLDPHILLMAAIRIHICHWCSGVHWITFF